LKSKNNNNKQTHKTTTNKQTNKQTNKLTNKTKKPNTNILFYFVNTVGTELTAAKTGNALRWRRSVT
jgi:hypothetical protein